MSISKIIVSAALTLAIDFERKAREIRVALAEEIGDAAFHGWVAMSTPVVRAPKTVPKDTAASLLSKLKRQAKALTADPTPTKKAERKPRNLSPAARKRIADAQKKRWANFRKEKGQ
jgi:hypothetical protein